MSFHAITIPPSLDPECELNQRLGALGGGPGAGALLCIFSSSGHSSSSGFPGVPGFGFEGKRHSAEQDTRMALRWRLMAIRPLAIILSEGSASFGCFSLLLRLRGDSFA